MPDYATHQKVNATVLVIFTTISLILMGFYDQTISLNHLIFAISFIISSWCLSPDLDTLSIPRKRWWYFGLIWSPFTHRGVLHSWIFAPIILTFPVTIWMMYGGLSLNAMAPVYIGIVVQCETHIILDAIDSKFNKKSKSSN